MTTPAERQDHIAKALAEHAKANGPTQSINFRDGMILPVIEVQTSFPVLNAESSRIAPLLVDDPRAELVRSDPDGGEAQAVVASLSYRVTESSTALAPASRTARRRRASSRVAASC